MSCARAVGLEATERTALERNPSQFRTEPLLQASNMLREDA